MHPHLAELKRRHKALEDEIADALKHCSTDDLMIGDLKRRKLHLKEEIERLRGADKAKQ
ncbi:MAG TPA: DUF465 domain-containing protein [Terriglobales bacterium]|nr:DUF465 domain-containing protein [Terriglobales bacterium]